MSNATIELREWIFIRANCFTRGGSKAFLYHTSSRVSCLPTVETDQRVQTNKLVSKIVKIEKW